MYSMEAGQRFGKLTVIRLDDNRIEGDRFRLWICRCDCGNEKSVKASHLRSGHNQSCGCLSAEVHTTHGMYGTPEYIAWANMIQRCTNPRNHTFAHYGGRGILVCERWLDSFVSFLEDMGLRTSPNRSIERRDNNGHYESSNCHWATPLEQAYNKRNSVWVMYQGRRLTLNELSAEVGLSYHVLYTRIKDGHGPEEAVAMGHIPRGRPRIRF